MLPGRSGHPGCSGHADRLVWGRWAREAGAPGTAVALISVVLIVSSCTNTSSPSGSGGAGAPGVTSDSITVGSIANVTGPLSSDFAPIVNGVEAYFDMVNAQGGVDGRKLHLAYQKDDQGSQTTDLTVAQELVEQDHVFAVVGVGTPFFGGAHYLASQGMPAFGYEVSTDWSDGPNLFGTYDSVLNFSTAAPGYAYVAKRLGARSVGVIAYGVAQSAAGCQAAIAGFHKYGIKVGYSDLDFPFGGDPDADVLHMKAAHVDLLFSCMDAYGNIAFARSIQQNGLSMHQVWLDGYDRGTLQQYSSLMSGVYVSIQHVPFEATTTFPGMYPGMDQYIAAMRRYEPAYTYDEIAFDGWINAAQFVAGLRAVGRNLTQAKLVAAIDRETAFTGGGVTTPINWTIGHTSSPPPWCAAYVAVQHGSFVPAFVQPGNEVFVCFTSSSDSPVAPLPGTPGLPGTAGTAGSSGGT